MQLKGNKPYILTQLSFASLFHSRKMNTAQQRNITNRKQATKMVSTATKFLPITTVALFLLLLTLLHLAAVKPQQPPRNKPPPPQALLNAAETLSNAGYNAMSLTLQLILADSTISLHSSPASGGRGGGGGTHLTIFTPPDKAFVSRGQPSLNLLLLHFSPLSLSLSSLSSLPFAAEIPSLSPSNSALFITSSPSDPQISINNVKVVNSPLYDDGSVVVFAVEDFFTLNFNLGNSTMNPKNLAPECVNLKPFSAFLDASAAMKTRGYSITATFLDLQLLGFMNFPSWPMKLTVFAPPDDVLVEFSGDFLGYTSLFLRHLFPCKLTWAELTGFENGTLFKDYVEGFNLKIERAGKEVMVNGVEITFPDMFYNDWLVIHGIGDVIDLPVDGIEEEEIQEEEDDSPAFAPDRNEF